MNRQIRNVHIWGYVNLLFIVKKRYKFWPIFFLLFGGSLHAKNDKELSAFRLAHQNIAEIMHGSPSVVKATSILCDKVSGVQPDKITQKILYKADGCKLEYSPNLNSLFSPLSAGGNVERIVFDEKTRSLLLAQFKIMANILSNYEINSIDKLVAQSTILELIHGLEFRRIPTPKLPEEPILPLIVRAHKLLNLLLLSKQELQNLPQSISYFPRDTYDSTLDSLARALEEGNNNFLEYRYMDSVHSQASNGRVYARTFITSSSPEGLQEMKEYYKTRNYIGMEGFDWTSNRRRDEKIDYKLEQSSKLPSVVSDIRLVLVLFYNALDTDYNVIPTQVIAKWSEIWYRGKISEISQPIDYRFDNFFVRVVEHLKFGSLVESLLTYREVERYDRPARKTFLDVNPVSRDYRDLTKNSENMEGQVDDNLVGVTTLKASCFGCHGTGRVRTFWRHYQMPLGFTTPFLLKSADVNNQYGDRIEDILKQDIQEYLE